MGHSLIEGGLTFWEIIYLVFQYLILAYFAILNVSYITAIYLGVVSISLYNRTLSPVVLKTLLGGRTYIPVSLLVPAYNEEKSIVASVRSMLSLHHPTFEVIVVSDGSNDRTLEVLIEAFGLAELPRHPYDAVVPTRPVRRIFRSLAHPNLLVAEKENGGKADALNAALNLAHYPLICAVDADSVLDVEALLRASLLFLQDETIVAVGGTVRPLNGAVMRDGQIRELRMPSHWIERIQILEYTRAFFSGRAGWAALDSLLVISGAFGLFKREVVLSVGGYLTNTVAEDMELVVRIHKFCRQARRPYRVIFTPDPLCWTEVPGDMGTLRRQRNRWHRGLWETLVRHRDMVFRPRYGRIGFIALPYQWFFEALSPAIELFGYLFVLFSFISGILYPEFALWFLLLAFAYGALVSQMTVSIEALLLRRYVRIRDRIFLFLAGLLEFCGYRQILLWERFIATFQVWRKRGQWGAMKRKGIS